MLTAAQRVRGDPDHGQQARDVSVDLVGDHFLVVGLRCLQRAEDVERNAGVAAGGVDRDLELRLELGHLGLGDTPGRKALLPHRGLLGGEGGDTGFLGQRWVDPRFELGAGQAGEDQRQVRQVALGIDEQARDAGVEAFLDKAHAQAGLARAGHAHDEAVGHQIIGGDGDVGGGFGASEKEVGHGSESTVRGRGLLSRASRCREAPGLLAPAPRPCCGPCVWSGRHAASRARRRGPGSGCPGCASSRPSERRRRSR